MALNDDALYGLLLKSNELYLLFIIQVENNKRMKQQLHILSILWFAMKKWKKSVDFLQFCKHLKTNKSMHKSRKMFCDHNHIKRSSNRFQIEYDVRPHI